MTEKYVTPDFSLADAAQLEADTLNREARDALRAADAQYTSACAESAAARRRRDYTAAAAAYAEVEAALAARNAALVIDLHARNAHARARVLRDSAIQQAYRTAQAAGLPVYRFPPVQVAPAEQAA